MAHNNGVIDDSNFIFNNDKDKDKKLDEDKKLNEEIQRCILDIIKNKNYNLEKEAFIFSQLYTFTMEHEKSHLSDKYSENISLINKLDDAEMEHKFIKLTNNMYKKMKCRMK